jgi:phage pi2 protein 07
LTIKNTVEVKDNVALIHINRAGKTQYAIIDADDLKYVKNITKNRLNIDSGGYVQHRTKKGGRWSVFQLHREIAGAFPTETILFKNNNPLDMRKSNMLYKTPEGKIYPVTDDL